MLYRKTYFPFAMFKSKSSGRVARSSHVEAMNNNLAHRYHRPEYHVKGSRIHTNYKLLQFNFLGNACSHSPSLGFKIPSISKPSWCSVARSIAKVRVGSASLKSK